MLLRGLVFAAGISSFCILGCHAFQDETNDISKTEARRSLRFLGLGDPKSTESKQQPTSTELKQEPRKATESKQTFNILALGGSITWGAGLQNRHEEAFPILIGELYNDYKDGTLDVSVDNMAIRATGADYPSICLQTLLSEANPNDPDKSYDLILLDFMMNGLDGITALMHRLRGRYPDAEIIMVELWSLKGHIEEVGTKLTVRDVGLDIDRKWTWTEHSLAYSTTKKVKEVESAMKAFNARYVSVPRPLTPQHAIDHDWFTSDWHHPSAYGHSVIAQTVFDFLAKRTNLPLMSGKRVMDWDSGDQCYNWFLTGSIPLSYNDASLNSLTTPDGLTRSFLEINPTGGTIEFVSKYDHPVLLSLGYMSRREPKMYPRVQVYVENDVLGANHSDNKKMYKINPSKNRVSDPTIHVSTYKSFAYVYPGKNIIRIIPIERTSQPFRVIGVYLCAVCTPHHVAMAKTEDKQ